ncbi:hypothetical protein [Aureimonas sp. SK2]|uniref:hypothetical protein n=1 Tax=Aureimonas sp. SK2 TaxID=3015992 RepID=UPI002443E92E|nr:hypothetical protein [Aureimonas sp. SK2]
MVQVEASIDRGAGALDIFRSNSGRILGSTVALGLAAYLAGSLVPPMHRVSLRLTGEPTLAARWTDEAVRDAAARTSADAPQDAPSGVLAVWDELIETVAPSRPDLGSERAPDGSLVIWAEAQDADAARRRVEAVAAIVIGETERTVTPAPIVPPATEPPAATVSPAAPDATIEALKASIAEARVSLAAAEDRLAKAPVPDADPSDSRSSLAEDRRDAAAAKQELARVERFARNLRNVAPAQAPASVQATEEWAAWRDARARRDQIARQAADLSRTLLDGHPRMATVRLRLSELEQDLVEARQRLSTALQRRVTALRRQADRLDRQVADAMVAEGASNAAAQAAAKASSEVEAARGTLAALEEALAQAERAVAEMPATAPPAPAAEPVAPPVPAPAPLAVVTEISTTQHRPTIWPIVAGAALFGFLGSSIVTLAGVVRRREPREPAAAAAPRRVFARAPAPAGPAAARPEETSRFSITAPDELIGGILASDVTRLVVVALGPDDRPAAVEIVRRLALRGRQGALVDLSGGQLAARAMGVAPDSLGVSDMIAGEATFAEIARSDFATRAEAFGAGRATVEEAAFLAMERRNVLEFIERNYEVLIVVCGDMEPETVKALLTPDAALVLTVDGADDARVGAGVERLRAAGLADMILVDGRQLAS